MVLLSYELRTDMLNSRAEILLKSIYFVVLSYRPGSDPLTLTVRRIVELSDVISTLYETS